MKTTKTQKTEEFIVDDMVCTSCEKIIEKKVAKLAGVKDVKANYSEGSCEVTFDPSEIAPERIRSAIGDAGYGCPTANEPKGKGFGDNAILLGVVAILVGAYFVFSPYLEAYVPSIGQNTSLALLFIIGLLTGFHCIAMCGGFVVSYATKTAANGKPGYISHLKFGAAKTASYAFFGALFGLLGSFITFTPLIRGLAAAFAGTFLILFGLNMLGYLKAFRRFRARS